MDKTKSSIRRSQRGFTILELVTAVAVISIVAGMAVMNWNLMFDRRNHADAARLVASKIKMAQARALSGFSYWTEEEINNCVEWTGSESEDGGESDAPYAGGGAEGASNQTAFSSFSSLMDSLSAEQRETLAGVSEPLESEGLDFESCPSLTGSEQVPDSFDTYVVRYNRTGIRRLDEHTLAFVAQPGKMIESTNEDLLFVLNLNETHPGKGFTFEDMAPITFDRTGQVSSSAHGSVAIRDGNDIFRIHMALSGDFKVSRGFDGAP